MALQTQPQGQFQEVVGLLKRRLWHILLPAVVTGALGVMAATLLPRKFESVTQIELVDRNLQDPAGADFTGLKDSVLAAEQHIKATERLRRVLEKLEWEDFQRLPPDEQREYIKRVSSNLKVRPFMATGTKVTFLELKYSDTDPQRAAQFINQAREVYVDEKIESVRTQAISKRDTIQSQLRDTDVRVDELSDRQQELRRTFNLSPTQQAPGGGRQREEDPVYQRLNKAIADVDAADKRIKAAEAKRTALQTQYEDTPTEIPVTEITQGVNVNAEVAKLEQQIVEQRALQDGIKPAHSQWQKADDEIRKLEHQRDLLLGKGTESTQEVRRVPNPQRRKLEESIDALNVEIDGEKATLASLRTSVEQLQSENQQRNEVYGRLSELDNQLSIEQGSQNALNQAFARQRQLVELLLKPEFSPFEVTDLALPASKPSSPNVPFLIGASLLIGIGMGLLYALVAEFGRNAYRGPADIGNALPIPVLGAINTITTSRQRNAVAFQRGLIGASTLFMAGAILWVTWAYENRPRLLGTELVRAIDNVREKFR